MVGKLLETFAAMTTRVPVVAVWTGKVTFPKGRLAKWRAKAVPARLLRKGERFTVAGLLAQAERDVAEGRHFLSFRAEGDVLQIEGWDWLDDWEDRETRVHRVLAAAAPLEAKGQVDVVGRFSGGNGKWTRFKLAAKKVAITEGDGWDARKGEAALAQVQASLDGWLYAHPDTRFRVENTGRWGHIDRDGREVIPPRFTSAEGFSEGLAVVHEDWKARFIDLAGNVLPGHWQRAGAFMRGLAPVAVEDTEHWGYIDRAGQLRIPSRYASAAPFYGPLAVVDFPGEPYRFITPRGELVGDPFDYYQYDERCRFIEGRIWTVRSDLRGFACLDEEARPAIVRRFHNVQPFSEGLAAVAELGATKWGYIDRDGGVVIPARFDEAYAFSEGRAVVRIGKEHRLIDRDGAFVGDPFASHGRCVKRVADGRLPFSSKSGIGFLTRDGDVAIKPRFEDAFGFHEGLGVASRKSRATGKVTWGHIDGSGEFVARPVFDATDRFSDGRAVAQMGRAWGFVDREDRWVVSPRYKQVERGFADGRAWVQLP
jgi:hypothetical protein